MRRRGNSTARETPHIVTSIVWNPISMRDLASVVLTEMVSGEDDAGFLDVGPQHSPSGRPFEAPVARCPHGPRSKIGESIRRAV